MVPSCCLCAGHEGMKAGITPELLKESPEAFISALFVGGFLQGVTTSKLVTKGKVASYSAVICEEHRKQLRMYAEMAIAADKSNSIPDEVRREMFFGLEVVR